MAQNHIHVTIHSYLHLVLLCALHDVTTLVNAAASPQRSPFISTNGSSLWP